MSIPPLVCSTPPPPEQCEDDKDPDDFGIPYNLSQDDDDDDFGYGDFSSYNHYQSNCIAQKDKTCKNVEISIQENKQDDVIDNGTDDKGNDIDLGTNITNINKTKSEEDTNIEDLGLEVDEELTSSRDRDDNSEDNSKIDTSEIVMSVGDVTTDDNVTSSPFHIENIDEVCSEDVVIETKSIDISQEIINERQIDDPTLDLDVQSSEPNSPSYEKICENDCESNKNCEAITDLNLDDDFGDFEDFQYGSSTTKDPDGLENFDNPWKTNEANNDDGFGNFTANFEPIESHNSQVTMIEKSKNVQKSQSLESKPGSDDDDDFGEFDDFKSSAIENQQETVESGSSESNQNMPVLNFQASDSEHQVMESITKVLTAIFEEEISEPDNEFDGRLESVLSETWRHLRETDVRQPYIINWNNSLGQKTLLRALCIDSRNILFGPKWGYNMPKYAVNLTAAPLQPQKPHTPSTPCQSDLAAAEKPTTKSGGWTDPFSADGQEFTYAEALLLDLEHLMATLDQMAHNHSTLKISELLSHACNTETESVVEVTSTDLDVFEAAISSKTDNKIYSSTLNVQPLRQISLPDTHIFTPTDSEIPTSKTVIHYDSGPPILLPQTVLESGNSAESSTTQQSNDIPKENKDEDDYWEFQDFKSNSEKNATVTALPTITTSLPTSQHLSPETKTENIALKSNSTYQTQVLQPIRMEPLIPTVNWPDPGEIKETFDDFSDFVSKSAWSENSDEKIPTTETENKIIPESYVEDKINDKHKNIANEKDRRKQNSDEDFEDDFDTFQSALPPKHIISEFNINNLSTDTRKHIPSENLPQMSDFDAFSKTNNVKSEIISNNNTTKQIEALPSSQANCSIKELTTSKKSSSTLGPPLPHNILQPIPHTSSSLPSQSKQQTGQILQPLSLEGYSQINWPNPGIDLQDLSRFNPVETLQSLKSDLSVGSVSKGSSPVHNQKSSGNSQVADDDWGEFISSKPKQATMPKKPASFVDDDEWTDFVSSPSVKPQNGLNTISLNVHTNSNMQKTTKHTFPTKNNTMPLDIPTLNYITPKASGHNSYNNRHFQNL